MNYKRSPEINEILKEVKGLEDCMKWMKAVANLDHRIISLGEAVEKLTKLFGRLIDKLEGKNGKTNT